MAVSMGLVGSTAWCRLRAVERGGGQLGRDDLDVSFGFCGCVYDDRFALEGVVLRCCVVVVCCGDVGRGCGAGRELSRRAAVAASAAQPALHSEWPRQAEAAVQQGTRAVCTRPHSLPAYGQHAALACTLKRTTAADGSSARAGNAAAAPLTLTRSASTPPREGPATAPALPEFVPCCPLHCRNTYKGRAFTRVTL